MKQAHQKREKFDQYIRINQATTVGVMAELLYLYVSASTPALH